MPKREHDPITTRALRGWPTPGPGQASSTQIRLAALCPLVMLASVLGACAAPSESVAPPSRPNIVLIMADDVGVEAFGCYGGTSYGTPRIDALGAGGLRFTEAYSQPLCTPTRVKLMTGRSNLRNYTRFSILDPSELTIGQVAKEAGYETAVAGKWQLLGAEHYGELAGSGTHPRDAGFDRWCLWQVETLGSRYANPTLDVDGELQRDIQGAYGPDRTCDFLLDFVAAERDAPFFVYYPMSLVHDPFVPTPDSAATEGKRTAQENFHDMVEYMDKTVGRIEDRLEELGLRENTLLIFTSDNGTSRKIRSMRAGQSIQGGKALSIDAGIHVPLIASWPGVVQPEVECSDLIGFDDFLPSLAELMDAQLPADRIFDGRSFAPQLRGAEGDPREVLTIYSNPRPPGTKRNPRVRLARDHRHKLYDDGRMYDCTSDPLEEHPLDLSTLPTELRKVHRKLTDALAAMPPEPAHLRQGR